MKQFFVDGLRRGVSVLDFTVGASLACVVFIEMFPKNALGDVPWLAWPVYGGIALTWFILRELAAYWIRRKYPQEILIRAAINMKTGEVIECEATDVTGKED